MHTWQETVAVMSSAAEKLLACLGFDFMVQLHGSAWQLVAHVITGGIVS